MSNKVAPYERFKNHQRSERQHRRNSADSPHGKTHFDQMKLHSLSSDRFPHVRMRRMRRTESIRDLVRENSVQANDLIVPLFVEENIDERKPLASMPGVFRETEKSLEARVKDIAASGVRGVMLFGVSHNKDHTGSDSMDPNGFPRHHDFPREKRRTGTFRHRRCLFLRIHRPRPLWPAVPARRCRQ